MTKRLSLYVFIEYPSSLDPSVCKKLQCYAKSCSSDILNPYIRIRTNKICINNKIKQIPKLKPNPKITTNLSFFISSSEQLYATFLLLIQLALSYSSKGTYPSHVSSLTISIPDILGNVGTYSFNWTLELQLN